MLGLVEFLDCRHYFGVLSVTQSVPKNGLESLAPLEYDFSRASLPGEMPTKVGTLTPVEFRLARY